MMSIHRTLLLSYAIGSLFVAVILARPAEQQGHLEKNQHILWMEPSDPSAFDFQYGIGGESQQPQPPFQFVEEDLTGTSKKVNVTDARGANWNVKFGLEVKPSTFCTRLVAACGYFSVPEYFVPQGRIEGVHGLKRAAAYVSRDGSFANARFQLRSGVPEFLDGESWAWTSNPFLGTRQLQGLKLLMLLLSNWDAKDARDMYNANRRGLGLNTNLGIFQEDSAGSTRLLYMNDDWGASLGKWGGTLTWTKWDCKGFAAQTPRFIKGVEDGLVQFGFSGKHEKDLSGDITVEDVKWLLKYLGPISDEQIRQGLFASGATANESDCYTVALRQRIEKLRQVAQEISKEDAEGSIHQGETTR
jgi:hypothetical protein